MPVSSRSNSRRETIALAFNSVGLKSCCGESSKRPDSRPTFLDCVFNKYFVSCGSPSFLTLWTRKDDNWWPTWNADLLAQQMVIHDYEPANGWLAVGAHYPPKILVLDIKNGKTLFTLVEQSPLIREFKFLNQGRSYAYAYDNVTRICNMQDKLVLHELVHDREVMKLVPFAKDQRMLTFADDLRIRTWDVETGRLETMFDAVESPIMSIIVSNDQKNVLTLDEKDTLAVWDLRVQQLLMRYKSNMVSNSHMHAVYDLAKHDWGIRLTDQYVIRQKRNRVIADRINMLLESNFRINNAD